MIWRKAGSSVSQALTSSLGIIGQGISGQESAYDPSGLEEILKEKSAVAAPMAAGQDSRGGKHAFSEPFLNVKTIILPRQARDKHRAQKEGVFHRTRFHNWYQ